MNATLIIQVAKRLWRLVQRLRTAAFTAIAKTLAGCYGEGLTVNGFTLVTPQTFLGKNVHFNGLRIRGGGRVTIGDNFHSGTDILFLTENHQYDGGNAIPYDTSATIKRDIVIEDNVWLGTRVLILGGVTIGEGAIIQAGSVVVSNIPKYAIAGGSPAKAFRSRDVEHYLRLKEARKFH